MFLKIISWIAVFMLSISYWFQIIKIARHKEVRDLSLIYNIFLTVGTGIFVFTAFEEKSVIFLVKQTAATIPLIIIVGQILYHRDDRWHAKDDPYCKNCKENLEMYWAFCPFCGKKD